MKVYKIFPDKGCNPHCEIALESAVEAVETWLSEAGVGATVSVEIIEMSKEDVDNLPEYMGP